MIIKAEDVLSYPEFAGLTAVELQQKLDALELLIRKHTNNNFQNRNIRFSAPSLTDKIMGYHPFLRVGDTIQISDSKVNDGLYVVSEINSASRYIVPDSELFAVNHNLVTKVEYPVDVRRGILNLMRWEVENRSKVGIKAESLSRHSVTYYDQDRNNQVMGYPVSLLGFLDIYKKARF